MRFAGFAGSGNGSLGDSRKKRRAFGKRAKFWIFSRPRMAATWLLQAIDPRTGQLLQDPTRGLLPPNDAQGHGAGFVSYTIQPRDGLPTGTPIAAAARLHFDTLPPEDTVTLVHTLDAHARKSNDHR